MTNGEFKDLPRRSVSDKVLRDEAFNIAKNRKDFRYQRGFDLVVSKFCFIKSILVMLLHVQINLLIKVKLYQTNNLLKNCTNQLLENVKNVKCYINKGLQFLLPVIDIFSKYAWVVPLKEKKCITITDGFQKF